MEDSRGVKVFGILNHIFVLLILVATLYPFYYIVVHSLNQGMDSARGGVYLFPRVFTLENYKALFNQKYMDINILASYRLTIVKTLLGTAASIATSGMLAYGLSRKKLPGVKGLIYYSLLPMYFSGGLIPTFMVVRFLGLYDTFSVFILLFLVQPFYIVVLKSFFGNFPAEIEEAATIDGSSDVRTFFEIVVPLSKPVIATISLYFAVWHWNDFTTALIYTSKLSLQPIQNMVYRLVNQMSPASYTQPRLGRTVSTITPRAILMTAAVVTSLPMILVYPFLQKYFVKGVMLGAIKG